MAYGVKYICEFDSIAEESYKVELLLKDYAGLSTPVIGGATPVIHSWENDDPKTPIKGSSVKINLINKNNELPLNTFFSESDDDWQVKIYWNDQLLFVGFIVQDDCQELEVDFTHEISLSANDNLGLLKNIEFNKVIRVQKTIETTAEFIEPNQILIYGTLKGLLVNDEIGFSINDIFYSYFTITKIEIQIDQVLLTVSGAVVNGEGDFYIKYYTYERIDDLNTPDALIFQYLRQCIAATGLQININVYANLTETSIAGDPLEDLCFIEYIRIFHNTFLNGNAYKSCYDVLSNILSRFNLTIFQSYGEWHIIRFDELRYYSNEIPYFIYDYDFNSVGSGVLSQDFNIGFGLNTYPEAGLTSRIQRPFSAVVNEFNYNVRENLFFNADLKILGPLLLKQTAPDLTLIRHYELLDGWYDGIDVPQPEKYVRIRKNNTGTEELERYIRILTTDNTNNKQVRAVVSNPFPVNKGDTIKIGFSFRNIIGTDIGGGDNRIEFAVEVSDGIDLYYLYRNGLWGPYSEDDLWDYSGDLSEQVWHEATIEAKDIPVGGVLRFYLQHSTLEDTGEETHYKNITVEYIPFINGTDNYTKQVHINYKPQNIKNGYKQLVYLDDTEKSLFKGTLFTYYFNFDDFRRTTISWRRNSYTEEIRKIGDIITLERLFWRRKHRTILEGNFRGLVNETNHVSAISIFNYAEKNTLNFINGRLEIDYKNNQFSTTMYEQYDSTETDDDLINNYDFETIADFNEDYAFNYYKEQE